jgi:histidinol phosphatase-like PHP family hydrolase
MMSQSWLLCDFHIHTSFSDGALTLAQVVDLYGQEGFDVIGISDHFVDETWCQGQPCGQGQSWWVDPAEVSHYLQAIWTEARRAWEQYQMLVIPGAELTNNTAGYHIVAIDVKQYIDPSQSVDDIVHAIHDQGGIAVAPHPHRGSLNGTQELMYLWDHHERFVHLFDAWEVANRDDLFNVVGLKKFNYIANSDFHEPRHLYSWKTLLRCDKNPEAVKAALRDNSAVSIYLLRPDKQMNRQGLPAQVSQDAEVIA